MYKNNDTLNFDRNIDTLCFSGGGTKGLVFIGAIKALVEKNVINLENITKYIGTSAGALIAFLLSIGYSHLEIEEFVLNFNFRKLEPDINCDNLFINFGLDDGLKLEYMLKRLLYFKLNKNSITFSELHQLTNKELIISTTCINNSKSKYFNYNFTPDDDVILAIRMSISVPFYFYPVEYEGNHYIDGGILDNYPIQFGNRESSIGLVVISDKYNKIKDFGNYMIKVIKLMLNANLINKIRNYQDCTIGIVSSEKNFIDFKLDGEAKKILINRGYDKVVKDYYEFTKSMSKDILNQVIDNLIDELSSSKDDLNQETNNEDDLNHETNNEDDDHESFISKESYNESDNLNSSSIIGSYSSESSVNNSSILESSSTQSESDPDILLSEDNSDSNKKINNKQQILIK